MVIVEIGKASLRLDIPGPTGSPFPKSAHDDLGRILGITGQENRTESLERPSADGNSSWFIVSTNRCLSKSWSNNPKLLKSKIYHITVNCGTAAEGSVFRNSSPNQRSVYIFETEAKFNQNSVKAILRPTSGSSEYCLIPSFANKFGFRIKTKLKSVPRQLLFPINHITLVGPW
jgi:hypothetical protein